MKTAVVGRGSADEGRRHGGVEPSAEASAKASLEVHREFVRERLASVAEKLSKMGLPRPALDGKILRPLSAYLTVPRDLRAGLDQRFWWGALAVEMVHEASLLHDDILDDAPERRGKPTLSAAAGIGPALVLGDHLLTAAYRVASETKSPEFLQVFIRAVERTVAGEIAQERAQGRTLEEEEYRRIVTGKSGELFRAVFSLSPAILGVGSVVEVGKLGAHMGCIYQMVDDFLDYCTSAERGKAPLQDFRQRKWTWPLGLIHFQGFHGDEAEIHPLLFGGMDGADLAPMELGVRKVRREVESLLSELRDQGLESDSLGVLLTGWVEQLQRSAAMEIREISAHHLGEVAIPEPYAGMELKARMKVEPKLPVHAGVGLNDEAASYLMETAAPLADAPARLAYFGHHAKSFRFAARLFPRDALEKVAGVYAFCRFTDDLVDEAGETERAVVEARLDAWLQLARQAYEGRETGVALLDDVMGVAQRNHVPFRYVEELVAGIRMDLGTVEFETQEDLRVYSFRVASVVGGWLTELFGIHDPWVLQRAFALGHAMQLTNILRDVGEDLASGRLYLPREAMVRHGVDRALLKAKVNLSSAIFPGHRNLVRELMAMADRDYEKAFEAIPALPRFFQGPVAVASRVYQGIHREIERNGFDNLSRRARTSFARKVRLAARALLDLAALRRMGREFPPSEKTEVRTLSGRQSQEAVA